MKREKKLRLRKIFVFMLMILVFVGSLGSGIYAKDVSIKDALDETYLITFEQRVDQSLGNRLIAHFYCPSEYKIDTYEYGIIIFPTSMVEEYDLTDNYFERVAQDSNIRVMTYAFEEHEYQGGTRFFSDMNRIPDNRLDRTFCYIVYVKDQGGNVVYKEPYITSFNTAGTRDISDEELLSAYNSKTKDHNFEKIVLKLNDFTNSIFPNLLICLGSVALVWGAYIGIRIMVSRKREEQINARGMVKHFIIGIIVMFVLVMALPLLVTGLNAFVGA